MLKVWSSARTTSTLRRCWNSTLPDVWKNWSLQHVFEEDVETLASSFPPFSSQQEWCQQLWTTMSFLHHALHLVQSKRAKWPRVETSEMMSQNQSIIDIKHVANSRHTARIHAASQATQLLTFSTTTKEATPPPKRCICFFIDSFSRHPQQGAEHTKAHTIDKIRTQAIGLPTVPSA